jgi:hypothetical protein
LGVAAHRIGVRPQILATVFVAVPRNQGTILTVLVPTVVTAWQVRQRGVRWRVAISAANLRLRRVIDNVYLQVTAHQSKGKSHHNNETKHHQAAGEPLFRGLLRRLGLVWAGIVSAVVVVYWLDLELMVLHGMSLLAGRPATMECSAQGKPDKAPAGFTLFI